MHPSFIILSYHKFVDAPSEYRFSRTYEQFGHDITKKVYDLITIDDGMICQLKACEMLRANNVRAKLFTCTDLVGTKGYCTWDNLRELSKYHDIENHCSVHKDHTQASFRLQKQSIAAAQKKIFEEIGKAPRYFVAPYNQYNADTDKAAEALGLITLKHRVNILNISK